MHIVVGFTPGGAPDMPARLLDERITTDCGQQVIVDNKPGAGGSLPSASAKAR